MGILVSLIIALILFLGIAFVLFSNKPRVQQISEKIVKTFPETCPPPHPSKSLFINPNEIKNIFVADKSIELVDSSSSSDKFYYLRYPRVVVQFGDTHEVINCRTLQGAQEMMKKLKDNISNCTEEIFELIVSERKEYTSLDTIIQRNYSLYMSNH